MQLHNDCEKILYTKEQIEKTVEALAERINNDYKGQTVLAVCILKGASVFYSDLIRKLNMDVRLDFMSVSSYGNATDSSGDVCIRKDLDVSIKDMHVLVKTCISF